MFRRVNKTSRFSAANHSGLGHSGLGHSGLGHSGSIHTGARPDGGWWAAVVLAAVLCGGLSCGDDAEVLLRDADALANTAAADSVARAIELYAAYASQYPERDGAPRALRMQARLTQQHGSKQAALGLYERLLADYSACDYAAEAQFMIGFIYEEHLRDLERARAAYQQVIDNYPSSELAVSARHLLPHVGRAAEDWVKFEEGATEQ